MTALPSGDVRILHLSNGGTTVGNIQLRASGALRLRNDSSTVGSETAALSANTLYRIGLRQRQGTGSDAVLEAYLAVGNAAFTTPLCYSIQRRLDQCRRPPTRWLYQRRRYRPDRR